ncbi:MAG: DNA mismatch repair endonuclease MutL [Limisphaerales bacterium]
MSRIRLLPEHVANQIAAGEVVERPASVVKELVENAMDAGAKRIVVEIQRGGRQLIRVEDDGMGMDRDDALMCLERHATSKIRSAEDLSVIRSMGFRGEALPSIASVSRFTLTTCSREGGGVEATQVVVLGGKMAEVKAVGHPPGTTVEVRQLFYNLPARRKFLRSEETERSHIVQYVTLAALAHPEIGFTLRQEDRVLWQLAPMPEGRELGEAVGDRLRVLLGADISLVRVEGVRRLPVVRGVDGGEAEMVEGGDLRVWGYVGASRATRSDQHIFVNGRPVDNRGLNYALMEGYHTALMKGRYPVACLFLEVDPAEVDVNVHPAKREVRFHRERAVKDAVASVVRDALLSYHRRSVATSGGGVKSGWEPRTEDAVPAGVGMSGGFGGAEVAGVDGVAVDVEVRSTDVVAGGVAEQGVEVELHLPGVVEVGVRGVEGAGEAVGERVEPDTGAGGGGERPLLRVPLRLLGVVARLYVVLESDRGMVLMDQHAAHERVLFEQMLQRLEEGEAASQRLLLPETVELSLRDAQFVRENLDVLSRMGVGLSEFGERTFLLDALPPVVRVKDSKGFVCDVIDSLVAAGRDVNKLRLGEDVVAKTVCRHAVKANDLLANKEIEKLIEDLRRCAMPYTCPHGRPTLIEISAKELEKKFGRVV